MTAFPKNTRITLTSAQEDTITDWTNGAARDIQLLCKEYQARNPERDMTALVSFLDEREESIEYSLTAYLQDVLPKFFTGTKDQRLITPSETERFPTDEDLMEHLTEFVNNTTNVHLIDWFTELQVLGNWNYEGLLRHLEDSASKGDLFEKVYDTIKEHMDGFYTNSMDTKIQQHIDKSTNFWCPQFNGYVKFTDGVCAGMSYYELTVTTGEYAGATIWVDQDLRYNVNVNSDGFGFNWGNYDIPEYVDSLCGGYHMATWDGTIIDLWAPTKL